MRRGKIFIYLALIVILGLAAAYLVFTRFLSPAETGQLAVDGEPLPTPTPIVQMVEVVALAQPQSRGAIIQEEVLTTLQFPKDDVLESMFDDPALVIGRRVKFDLEAGMVLTSGMLVGATDPLSPTGSDIALEIPERMVAVSIPITRLSSVSYAPRPGDHVMVIMTMMFVDLDSEFQTRLPNQVSGVMAPGPLAVLGTNVIEGLPAGEMDEYAKQDLTIQFADENIAGANSITTQVVGGGALALRGRTEIDPIVNELFYVVPAEQQRARLVSQTFLYDVIVLQVGDFKTEAEEIAELEAEQAADAAAVQAQVDAAAGTPNQQGDQAQPQVTEPAVKMPDVITIAVRPQDAVTLNYLLYSGAELTLALRRAGDTSIETTEAATLQFLLDEYNIPVPAKLPFGLEPKIGQLVPPVLSNDELQEILP